MAADDDDAQEAPREPQPAPGRRRVGGKRCPECGARLLRGDVRARYTKKGYALFAAATLVTLVWAPFVLVAGLPVLAGQPSLAAWAVLGAVALAPGLALGSRAGRPHSVASCRGCRWKGAASAAQGAGPSGELPRR